MPGGRSPRVGEFQRIRASEEMKRFLIDKHIRPYFCRRYLSDINSTDILQWQNALLSKRDENGKGYAILLTFTDDESGVYVTASHMNEEEQTYYRWDAFGDIQGSVISYNNAVCLKMVLDPQSETGIREETVYSDGKGTMEITKDDKIIWKDEKVNDGEEIVLAWDQTLTDEVQEQAQTGQN